MFKIEAIIQPARLDTVRQALKTLGVDGVTISEVRGHGRQKGHREVYRGREYFVDFLPKIKLEMVVTEARKEEVIQTIMEAARSGNIGDGKIFVYDVGQAIRIRNNDRAAAARDCGDDRRDRRRHRSRCGMRRRFLPGDTRSRGAFQWARRRYFGAGD